MDYAASVTLKWLVHRKSLLHSQHIKLVNAPDASSDAKSDISDRHVLPFSDRKLLTLPYLHALSSWLVSDLPSPIMYRSGVRPSVRLFLTLCSSIRHILKVARQRAACGWSRPEVWGSTQTCLVLEREWLVSCWRVRRLRVTWSMHRTVYVRPRRRRFEAFTTDANIIRLIVDASCFSDDGGEAIVSRRRLRRGW